MSTVRTLVSKQSWTKLLSYPPSSQNTKKNYYVNTVALVMQAEQAEID